MLKDNISQDLKTAMKARDKDSVAALRLIMAAVKQVEVDKRIVVDDSLMLTILEKMVKQRRESIAQFLTAQRDDLVAQEKFELGLIKKYLPEQLTELEVNTIIDKALVATQANNMADMGRVMSTVKPQLSGRADLKKVSERIKSKLS